VFLFFAGMMVLQLVWVKESVVETKGVPLEQIAARLGVRLNADDRAPAARVLRH
jgi:hypothetical protein